MQTFNLINAQDRVKKSRATINANFEAVASNFSGIAFPTVNLYVGMKCYRTDLNQTFTLNNVELQTWVDDSDIADKAIRTEKLADQSVTKEKIAPSAITTEKITNGAVTKDKIAPGVLTASNVGAYDKAATYNRDEINKSFRKIGDKRAGGSVDWNTLTEPMTYNIQNAIMNNAMHAPANEYNFGLLVVHRLENGKDHENRTVQVYYPHTTRGYWSRMLNGSVWTEWRYIPTHNEVEVISEQKASTRVSKNGDTMTGALNFALNTGKIIGKVGNDASYWQIWGSDYIPSTAYDVYGNGTNAEKGVIYARKFINGSQVVSNKIIAEDNNAYFQHAVGARTFYANDWYRAKGQTGFCFEDYGGGWYMQDTRWIHAWNGKDVHTTGKFRGDNGVEVTGNSAFIFASHGGALYMSDDTWIRSSGGKSIYTAGKMKADGGFEGKASSAGWADGCDYSNRAVRVENDYGNMRFHWSGQDGQPTWLWGGNDGENMYVYNPFNFTVSRANTAGRADTADNATNAINATNATKARQIDGNVLVFSNGTKIWVE